MNVVELSDAEALWLAASELLSHDPANNTVTLSALQRIQRDGATHGEKFLLITDSHGTPTATFVRMDTRHAALSKMSENLSRTLGRAVRERRLEIEGVVGEAATVNAFVEGIGLPAKPFARLMLYVHEGEVVARHAGGQARLAENGDAASVAQMLDAFEAELSMIKGAVPAAARAARRIAAREIVLWEVDGHVVAMAGANPLPASSARIGPVYVLPEYRRRGIAQAITATATGHVQRDRQRTVFLFTDATNPASNKAYQRIGYRHIADHLHLLL